MHSALFRSNNVKQNRLDKRIFLKKRAANVQIFQAIDCNQVKISGDQECRMN